VWEEKSGPLVDVLVLSSSLLTENCSAEMEIMYSYMLSLL